MQMTTENREGMKDASTLNVIHISRKPLQCIDVTTPLVGHFERVRLTVNSKKKTNSGVKMGQGSKWTNGPMAKMGQGSKWATVVYPLKESN